MKKLFAFSLINALLAAIISIRYFLVPGASGSWSFAVFASLGHFFSLYVLLFLICTPLLFCKKIIRHVILALIFTFMLILLYMDTIVFEQYRFHINLAMLKLVLSGQVVTFSLATYARVFALVLGVFCIEFFFLRYLDKRYDGRKGREWLWLSSSFLLLALIGSNIGYMIGFYFSRPPIMVVKEYLPLYYPLTSKSIMSKFVKKPPKANASFNADNKKNANYPAHPITIGKTPKPPTDIIFLMIDAWRPDTFSPEVSPNAYRFVQEHHGVIFNRHYSTGNATRTGIFGLFYGVPGTYWSSFLNNGIPAPFITTLQHENYNIGVFTSAKVSFPEFDRTVFLTVKNLRIKSKGEEAPEKDANLTKDWIKWNQERDKNVPAFSFLFYDSAHAYDFPADMKIKFSPMSELNYMTLNRDSNPELIFNRYRQSVYYVDTQFQQIFDELKASGRLDNTLIIITTDHSQEMNDNHMGFWGHNGNFTDAQTQIPFIVVGAKDLEPMLRNNVDKVTTHEDVVPSLMKHYLGVTNDTSDYSTGYDLFSDMPTRNWWLISSYSSYGVRTKDNIYQVNAIGVSHFMDGHNKEIDASPNYKYVTEAMAHMSQFYR